MKNKQSIIAALKIKTPEGDFVARYSTAGLAELDFPDAAKNGRQPEVAPAKSAAPVKRWHELTSRAVREVLQGRTMTAQPPVDLSRGTAFQQKVWGALQAIPLGQTVTYADIAASVKKPKAARAVGGACGANPIPLLVPCHRVVAAGGGLGGFTSGLPWKKKLLGRESVRYN